MIASSPGADSGWRRGGSHRGVRNRVRQGGWGPERAAGSEAEDRPFLANARVQHGDGAEVDMRELGIRRIDEQDGKYAVKWTRLSSEVPRQRGPAQASRPGLRPRQGAADAGLAEGGGTLVTNNAAGLSGKADQGWGKSGPRSSAIVIRSLSDWPRLPRRGTCSRKSRNCPMICDENSFRRRLRKSTARKNHWRGASG